MSADCDPSQALDDMVSAQRLHADHSWALSLYPPQPPSTCKQYFREVARVKGSTIGRAFTRKAVYAPLGTGVDAARCSSNSGEDAMKTNASIIAATLSLLALPVMAQSTAPSHVAPSTQRSGTGVAGLPGGKSGPAVRAPQGQQLSDDQTNPAASHQDSSAVQGKPGNKNGPTVSGL